MRKNLFRRSFSRLLLLGLCLGLVVSGPLAAGAKSGSLKAQQASSWLKAGAADLAAARASSTAQITTFGDILVTHPFYTEIMDIAMRQVTLGCGGGSYCPDAPVTREQMAAFIIRALGEFNPPPPQQPRFLDVPPTNQFYNFIDRLAALGITSGCGGGNYCPGSAVTREQMAAFLLRALGEFNPPPPQQPRFLDVPPSNQFYNFIDRLAALGITSGCGGGNYCPTAPVTRGAMAAFLVRAFGWLDPGTSVASVGRFLEQATWGPTPALIAQVQNTGLAAYLNDQLAQPVSAFPNLPLQPTSIPSSCDATCQRDNYTMYPLQNFFFTNAMYGPNQLRQRVAFALHQIMVISGIDEMQPSWVLPYLQILENNAFGNYRQLLSQITLNPGMGRYLDMFTSTKVDPNENYAREINQLFSVGTALLNPDGTPQLDGQNNPIPTYDQSVVTGFAHVFTGWRLAAQPQPGVANYVDPMVLVASNHDTGTKQLLNYPGAVNSTLPPNQTGDKDLNDALDNIFNHPNVGPFISQQLTENLVTSNPSPGYVGRVASVFNNNGQGVRGDLKSVVMAVLLDPEARGEGKNDPSYGHLKNPALFATQILRVFNARSANGLANSDGYINPQAVNMGMDIYRPPTVFSYYPADYEVAGTNGLSGPEFGILAASTALRRANFVNTMAPPNSSGVGGIGVSGNSPQGTALDLSAIQALAGDPSAMVDELNRIMMHGSMSTQMHDSIVQAVTAVASNNSLKRARTGVYLVATSSQYQVQR